MLLQFLALSLSWKAFASHLGKSCSELGLRLWTRMATQMVAKVADLLQHVHWIECCWNLRYLSLLPAGSGPYPCCAYNTPLDEAR